MFYYIDQACTPSFPSGLVKTKSDFIVRSVETGSERWMLVVAVIGVDAYPFLAFSDLICHLEDTGMDVLFSGCNVLSDSKETQLGSRNQQASPSAGKNTRIVLVPCWAWKCILTAISDGEDISKVPGCHLLWQMSSQWDSKKLLQRLVFHELTAYLSVFNLLLTQWIMAILSKGYKPDNFEPHNSLKLSFTNFWGLCSNSVEYESFLESNSPDVLTLCETKLGWLNWFWQFLCEGWFFVLSINPSANAFVFGDFNIHHKDWLTYSGGIDRHGELCYIFSISNNFTQIVNFPTRIPDCDSHSPALLDLFLSSYASICSAMASPRLENWSWFCLSFHWLSSKLKTGCLFHCVAYDYILADWHGLCDHLKDVPREDIFKLSATAASEFVSGSVWNWCIYPSS